MTSSELIHYRAYAAVVFSPDAAGTVHSAELEIVPITDRTVALRLE